MSIVIPNTFVAGTKAKAQEVNANFTTVYNEVNSQDGRITQAEIDIISLDSTKANKNGSTGNTFSVANPTNGYHAVNKQTLTASIANSIRIIQGMGISEDSNDTILVQAGSCYDSTLAYPITLSGPVTKQNTTQSISTTYYVYAISKALGASPDVLISASNANPALPTDYTLYRLIGEYVTDASNHISDVINYQPSQYQDGELSLSNIIEGVMPDYNNGVSVSNSSGTNTNLFKPEVDGWLIGRVNANSDNSFKVNLNSSTGTNLFTFANGSSSEGYRSAVFPVTKNLNYYVVAGGGMTFYKCKGAV